MKRNAPCVINRYDFVRLGLLDVFRFEAGACCDAEEVFFALSALTCGASGIFIAVATPISHRCMPMGWLTVRISPRRGLGTWELTKLALSILTCIKSGAPVGAPYHPVGVD